MMLIKRNTTDLDHAINRTMYQIFWSVLYPAYLILSEQKDGTTS